MKVIINFSRILLATLIFSLIQVSAMAQAGVPDLKNATPAQRADYQTKMMVTKLKLDSGQVTKVKAINLKYALKFQPIIKSSDSRFSKMRQAKSLQEGKDKELQTVFSKDQYKQYQAFESEMKSKMMAKMNGN